MTNTPAMPELPRETVIAIGKKHFPKTTLSNAWFGFAADIALATLQAQPAEVSDAELRKTIDALRDPGTVSAFYNGYYTLTPDELRRAILALRPAAQTEREAFEAEMRCEETWGHRSLRKHVDGRYQNWVVDALWTVWQARASLPASQQATPEPVGEEVYQIRLVDGAWMDLTKHVYEEKVKLGHLTVRKLYTHPAPGVPESPCQLRKRFEQHMRDVFACKDTAFLSIDGGKTYLDGGMDNHWRTWLAAQAKGGEHE